MVIPFQQQLYRRSYFADDTHTTEAPVLVEIPLDYAVPITIARDVCA